MQEAINNTFSSLVALQSKQSIDLITLPRFNDPTPPERAAVSWQQAADRLRDKVLSTKGRAFQRQLSEKDWYVGFPSEISILANYTFIAG